MIESIVYVQNETDKTTWKKRYLRSELGWIRIFKRESKNSECLFNITAGEIIDITTPSGSLYDRGQNTLIILTFKRKKMSLCAETTSVWSSLNEVYLRNVIDSFIHDIF